MDPVPLLVNPLAAAATAGAGHEPDPAAAIALLPRCLGGQVLEELAQHPIVMQQRHLLRSADVVALDKQPWQCRHRLGALHQIPELPSEGHVHGHVPFVHSELKASQDALHVIAALVRVPDSPQAREVEHHPLLPTRRTPLLKLVERVRLIHAPNQLHRPIETSKFDLDRNSSKLRSGEGETRPSSGSSS